MAWVGRGWGAGEAAKRTRAGAGSGDAGAAAGTPTPATTSIHGRSRQNRSIPQPEVEKKEGAFTRSSCGATSATIGLSRGSGREPLALPVHRRRTQRIAPPGPGRPRIMAPLPVYRRRGWREWASLPNRRGIRWLASEAEWRMRQQHLITIRVLPS